MLGIMPGIFVPFYEEYEECRRDPNGSFSLHNSPARPTHNTSPTGESCKTYLRHTPRGKRRKLGLIDAEIPEIAGQEPDSAYRKKCRANWARLIQKIYEIDPLTCPKCGGIMRILAFIEESPVIRKILDHLGLWDVPKR